MAGFYYVDQSAAGATDSSNPYGWPGRPRASIPTSLPAGSVVELHGTYTRGHESPSGFQLNGTSASPVYIRGANAAAAPTATRPWQVSGSHFILENIQFTDSLAILAPVDRGVLRHSDVRGNLNGGGIFIGSWGSSSASYVVISDTRIHDNGDINADFDQDVHGIQIGWNGRADHVWILDCELYRNSGDGLQIAAGSQAAQASVHHIYVGRNVSHNNKQTGMWSKQAVDVIFSQNTIYAHRAGNSSYGAGTGFQYAPENIWFLFNHIFDCEFGIAASSDSGLGSGTNSYFIGNVIHNIHPFSGGYNPDTAWSNAAFMFSGGVNRWVMNNTMHDVAGGINVPGASGKVVAISNLISGLSGAGGSHLFVELGNVASASAIQYTLLGETPRLRWADGTTYTSVSSFQNATGTGQNTIVAAPQFVNPGANDFHLTQGSPGTFAGIVDSVYNTFLTRYGIDIRKAADGVARPPVGQLGDIGAYQTGGGGSAAPPAAPTNLRIIKE